MYIESFGEGRAPIETLECPFSEEPDHAYVFDHAEEAFKEANDYLRTFWKRIRKVGFEEVLLASKTGGSSIQATIEIEGRDSVSYDVGYHGEMMDIFGQRVNVFQFTKDESEPKGTYSKSLKIATLAGVHTEVSELAAFRVEDEDLPINLSHFQFLHGELVALAQISKPGLLYPNLESDSPQFIELGFMPEDGDPSLIVRAGIYEKTPVNQGSYRNIGGTLTRSRYLRVANVLTGEMELSSQSEDVVASFRLYPAVRNLAYLLPATEY